MLIKGDKIRMIKGMPGFDKVGDEFNILDITEDGVITMVSSYGRGIMSYDEFIEYFEKVEKFKNKWTKWESCNKYHDIMYCTNLEEIKMHCSKSNVTAKVSCHKDDVFDLDLGLKICFNKLQVMKSYKDIKNAEKQMKINQRAYRKQLRELN